MLRPNPLVFFLINRLFSGSLQMEIMKTTFTFFALTTLLIVSCGQPNLVSDTIDSEIIEAKVSNYLTAENSIGEHSADSLLTENFIRNINGIEMVSNINEHRANMHIFLTGFPDMILIFPTRLIKDSQAYIGWTSFTGTNTGAFGELKATGKKVKISGISHLYFDESNKIYKEDVFYNELDLIQQLGYTLNPPITE